MCTCLRVEMHAVYTDQRYAIFGHVARLPDNILAHQAMLRQVELSVGRPTDPAWKRPPGRPRAKWTDQLRRDNNNVPIVTLWRQAIAMVAVTRERRYGPSRLRVNDDDDDDILTWGNMQPRVTATDCLIKIRVQHVALVHPVVLRVALQQVCKVQIACTEITVLSHKN